MSIEDDCAPRPYLPTNRFWYPIHVFGHSVFPLTPLADDPSDLRSHVPWGLSLSGASEDDIDVFRFSFFNVGMHCGTPSRTTILEVNTEAAQLWLDEQDLPITPQWLSRGSRCYLFNYMPVVQAVTCIRPGVRLLNHGALVLYPGSIYDDGRLVYWEISPDWEELEDLPSHLFPTQTSVSAES